MPARLPIAFSAWATSFLVEKRQQRSTPKRRARRREDAPRRVDLADLREQLAQRLQHVGGMSGLLSRLPGIAKIKKSARRTKLDEKVLKRQMAIVNSMTPQENARNPETCFEDERASAASPPAPAPNPKTSTAS